MIDKFKIFAKGGDGGNGCFSLRRGLRDRRGSPDGVLCFRFITYSFLQILTFHFNFKYCLWCFSFSIYFWFLGS